MTLFLYDELYYNDKPDLEARGLLPIHLAYTFQLWGENDYPQYTLDDVPTEALLTYRDRYGLTGQNTPSIVILNIEHWVLYNTTDEIINESADKYIEALRIIRSTFPTGTIFSIYNVGPLPSHFSYFREDLSQSQYDNWVADNDKINRICDTFDMMTPSTYHRYDFPLPGDPRELQEDWERRASYYIDECKRMQPSKPIYPFIWPEWSDREDPQVEIEPLEWRNQLDYFQSRESELAGIVLWRRHKGPTESDWPPNDDFKWWGQTKNWMFNNGIIS